MRLSPSRAAPISARVSLDGPASGIVMLRWYWGSCGLKGLLRTDTVMAAAVQACARSFSAARVVWLATDSASQRKRKRVEEVFGWLKTVGGMRKKRFIGKARTQIAAYLSAAVYNMLRIAKLRPPGVRHDAAP